MNQTTAVSLNSYEIPRTEEMPAAVRCIGIKALMLAVLEDAINCLHSSQTLVRTKAEHWITSRERRHVFSFVVICETLELEPSSVRRSVLVVVDPKRTEGRLLKRSRPNGRRCASIQPVKSRHAQ